jgi:NAD(P)-dependent dehydrogenase (short-subunit alcohol dehydrogenase family)
MRVVITGANRGIGLEFARRHLERGDVVEAAVRDPARAGDLKKLADASSGKLRIHPCDVGADASVRAFASGLGGEAVDVLINNAGVMGKMQGLEALEFDALLRTIDVNAVGALRVVSALLPLLRKGHGRKIAHITSGMGSIGDNTSGGAYGYRMSKAALNMASRSIAVDLRGEKIISVVINPGWVKTDMGGSGAPTPVEESVRAMMRLVDGLTLEQSGSFLDYRGHTWPW